MNRFALQLLAAAALIAPHATAETKSYPTSDFTEISAKGAIDVIYSQGAEISITVEQIKGDFSDILIEEKKGELTISRISLEDSRGWNKNVRVNRTNGVTTVKINGKKKPAYTVTVTAPDVSTFSTSTSARLIGSNINVDALDARVSSSGDMELAGTATTASLRASSSGDLEADKLAAGALEIKASSSADVLAQSTGSRIDITASSSSDVEIVSTGPAVVSINASSSSDIDLSGTCASLEASASSSSGIDANGLKCAAVDISASSSADVSIYASSSIVARASSGADIDVSGDPTDRDVRDSSGGNITFN